MNFRQNLRLLPSLSVTAVPFTGVILQVVFLFLLAGVLSSRSTFDVRIPRAVTSDVSHEDTQTVVITGEDVMYLDGRLVTSEELRLAIAKPENRSRQLLIKSDRRASVGRIVEVWSLARGLGLERVDLATDQGN